MTIFILDEDRGKCAAYLDDINLEKMIHDIAQVLCNVHREVNHDNLINNPFMRVTDILYKTNKVLKYWSEWAALCKANYSYIAELGIQCEAEYCFRIKTPTKHLHHNLYHTLKWCNINIPDLPVHVYEPDEFSGGSIMKTGLFGNEHLPIPLIMPKKHILEAIKSPYDENIPQSIQSYRNYYAHKLDRQFEWRWKHRGQPDWLEQELSKYEL